MDTKDEKISRASSADHSDWVKDVKERLKRNYRKKKNQEIIMEKRSQVSSRIASQKASVLNSPEKNLKSPPKKVVVQTTPYTEEEEE